MGANHWMDLRCFIPSMPFETEWYPNHVVICLFSSKCHEQHLKYSQHNLNVDTHWEEASAYNLPSCNKKPALGGVFIASNI